MIAALFLSFAMAPLAIAQAAPLPKIVSRRPAEQAAQPAAETVAESAAAASEPEQPSLPPRSSLIGDWALGLSRRQTRCTIRLDNHSWGQGLATASIGSNCPESLFAVSRWRLTATELELTNRTGRPLARLMPKDGAWRGTVTGGDGVVMERRR